MREPFQWRLPHEDLEEPDLYGSRLSKGAVEINGVDPTMIYSHSTPKSKKGKE